MGKQTTTTFRDDFLATDWSPLTPNKAFGVYGLALYINHPNAKALAADASTDSGDDKKIDFCFLDYDRKIAFIGQSYLAEVWGKRELKGNKAGDLALAASHLLDTPAAELSPRIRPKAAEVRAALTEGTIKTLELIYVHNGAESHNVGKELRMAGRLVQQIVNDPTITVRVIELGANQLQELYESIDKEILVEQKRSLPMKDCRTVSGTAWIAILGSLPGSVLHDLYREYGTKLFSANFRDFLGVHGDKSINAEIAKTAAEDSENFWVYNNGITILTNKILAHGRGSIKVQGLSIINGAQTTGVLGQTDSQKAADVLVPCRIVECTDDTIIANIISCNNTQNEMKSFDLRSKDDVQKKLRIDFAEYGIRYVHRRGATRLAGPTAIHASTVAPALAAFHGSFQVSIRNRATIFEEDARYSAIFPHSTTAEHVYLIQSLADAIDLLKLRLKKQVTEGEATDLARLRFDLLDYSTSKYFVIFATGLLVQQIVGHKVPDAHAWRCREEVVTPNRQQVVLAWEDFLEKILPRMARFLSKDARDAVRTTTRGEETAADLADRIEGDPEDYENAVGALRALTTFEPRAARSSRAHNSATSAATRSKPEVGKKKSRAPGRGTEKRR
jgi:hypothetical protein